jgi:hypothetical protein
MFFPLSFQYPEQPQTLARPDVKTGQFQPLEEGVEGEVYVFGGLDGSGNYFDLKQAGWNTDGTDLIDLK